MHHAAATAAGVAGNMLDSQAGSSRGHCSDLDLPSYERLPVGMKGDQLHRPDSVITTSSIVSSETGDSLPVPPPPPPDVYTISGLYGGDISHTPAIQTDKEVRTHKRSTSNTAVTSIIRGCQQMTHKRSHSHTVGYNHQNVNYTNHHRRNGSSGFVMGHRRTASGALVDALDKMTGGVLDSHSHHQSSSEMLNHGIQKSELERRVSKADQAEEMEEDYADLRDCGYFGCKPAAAKPLASIKV